MWCVFAQVAPEIEEVAIEAFSSAFGEPATAFTDVLKGTTTVSAYLGCLPDLQDAEERLGQAFAAWGVPDSLVPRLAIKRVRREDWAESWKKHFRPMLIASRLLVKPSWSRVSPRKGQACIILDPGLSFGTGQHPTTAFCLEQLVKRRGISQPQSFLDIGTGSGILAIAAAKLGYRPVRAFDYDPDSVRVARANSRQNRVSDRMVIAQQDVRSLPLEPRRSYSLVCANLISNLLVAERARITAQVAPNGWLVLAGILHTEFSSVQQAFETVGFKLVSSRKKAEWRSGSFTRRNATS